MDLGEAAALEFEAETLEVAAVGLAHAPQLYLLATLPLAALASPRDPDQRGGGQPPDQAPSSLRMTDAQFGLLTSVFLWVYAVLSPFAGFLADRFSLRKYHLSESLPRTVRVCLQSLPYAIQGIEQVYRSGAAGGQVVTGV